MLSRDHVEAGLSWNWRAERVARWIRHRETNVAVAMSATELAGFGIMRYQDTDAHLMLFAVAADISASRYRHGIDGWLETTAMTAGIELIWLEARANNSDGARVLRRARLSDARHMHRYYSGVEDAVRIGKDLTETKPSSYVGQMTAA